MTEDMKPDGGIDMDSWPEITGIYTDVNPVLISDNAAIAQFQAANGAVLTKSGTRPPIPRQCDDELNAADGGPSAVVNQNYYCVRTSRGKLILFQVAAVYDDAVTLRGFAPARKSVLSQMVVFDKSS